MAASSPTSGPTRWARRFPRPSTYTRSFPRKGDKGAYTLVVTDNTGLTGGVTQRVVVP
jgi:hypothetical protein